MIPHGVTARLLALCLTALAGQVTAQTAPKEDPPLPASIQGCPVIEGPFRFCGTAPEFPLTPQSDNSAVTTYYATPEGIQAIAIVEDLGSADGLNIPSLQREALEILSQSTGQTAADIPVLERSVVTVDGRPTASFVYYGNVGGTDIVYSNSMVLLDRAVAQFVTLHIGALDYTPSHRDLHSRFLAHVRVSR